MAGGHVKYRHLSRSSAHRQALLRNLVTSLVKNESIHTTWHKAKEAQRFAEKLITLGKRNNVTARRKAQGILFTPHDLMPKLFGELRERYADRQGGYTRILRTEPKDTYSQAPSAVLELVDGPKDMRFAMTAAAVARDLRLGRSHTPLTNKNLAKVTRFRPDGKAEFEKMVARISGLQIESNDSGDEEELPLDAWQEADEAEERAEKKVSRSKKRRAVGYHQEYTGAAGEGERLGV